MIIVSYGHRAVVWGRMLKLSVIPHLIYFQCFAGIYVLVIHLLDTDVN
jgi:hypothetical protein